MSKSSRMRYSAHCGPGCSPRPITNAKGAEAALPSTRMPRMAVSHPSPWFGKSSRITSFAPRDGGTLRLQCRGAHPTVSRKVQCVAPISERRGGERRPRTAHPLRAPAFRGRQRTPGAQRDKAWVEALTLLLDVPPTDRDFIVATLAAHNPATLAHLFFHLHFYLVKRSGEWIHDGDL